MVGLIERERGKAGEVSELTGKKCANEKIFSDLHSH